jgi:hypothetical protein
MTKTFKIAAEPVPSPLQPTRWSFFIGGKLCGEAATRAQALRAARELVDSMQRGQQSSMSRRLDLCSR